ncbi:MAG TPA: DUF6268 family outer membrane beta-barrel protein [Pirellulaceae bacterium]|nr:DUF6268 family outer membrane beta-barrel protein [Pirellulaceae bacterium]
MLAQAPATRNLSPRLTETLREMSQGKAKSKTDSFQRRPPPSIDGPDDLPEPQPGFEEMVEPVPQSEHKSRIELTEPAGEPVLEAPLEYYDSDTFYFQPPKLKAHRDGFFQKLSLSGTWLYPGTEEADIGFTDIETFGVFALPFPIVEWPLVITPGYNLHLLDGPEITDLPPRLHDAYVDFMWLPTFVHRWTMLLSVMPGYYSDFQVSDSDAFRLTGKGIVIFDADPERLQLVAGLLYLGRDNLKLLPVGGAIWRPSDNFAFELIFPKPKLAVRLSSGPGFENWLYGTAEYGGNTYVIERVGGAHDKVTYQDFRLLVGFERRLNYGAGFRLEAGYVFGRQVDFASATGDFEPGDTVLLRAGITF